MSLQTVLQQRLSRGQESVTGLRLQPVGGGSINETFRVSAGDKSFLCKANSATKFPQLFVREKSGLALIRQQDCIRTPDVIDCFEQEGTQVLLLTWIEEGERTDAFWKTFGKQLASLHRQTADTFGGSEDNYMGSVPQRNRRHASWTDFFANERLQPLTERCTSKSLLNQTHVHQLENLQRKLPLLFAPEPPSLQHGDLWSGNFLCNQTGEPVLIDPAVYYGHRSVDLAMTTMFGGFHPLFYEAYHHHFPLPLNYREQWRVCNLYPLLVHLYLFGRSYLLQIESTLKQFA